MPRYRKLHVKTVESLDINDMPDDFTRLLWVLLPLALCRKGRGVDNVAWVKSRVFPMRLDVTGEMIAGALNWYEQRDMLRRYQVDGRGYFYVPTFPKYQGNTEKEAESNYPPPPEQQPQEVSPNSGVGQELGESKSASDAICNIQYADAGTHPPENHQTPAELTFLEVIGPFEDKQDKIDILAMETQAGSNAVCDAIRWARRKHIPGDSLIQSIITAASKWSTGPPSPFVPTVPQEPVVIPSAAFNATPGVD
jgi:hypothetical protein